MILIIDNYDSFTYNIAQYVGECSKEVNIKKNNQIKIEEISESVYSHIIISPGPGKPSDAGVSNQVINNFFNKIPILGICLGHQVIGKLFGCRICNARNIMHGKVSTIEHNRKSLLFNDVPKYFNATRYHSLIVDQKGIGQSLIVNSWLEDGSVMGIEHKNAPIFGVQFHPESIETEVGKTMINNFLNIV